MTSPRANLTDLAVVLSHLPFYAVLRRYPPEVTVPFLRRACWHDEVASGRAADREAWAASLFAELPAQEREQQQRRLVAYLSTRMVDVLFVRLYGGYQGFLERHIAIDGREAWESLKRQYGRAVLVTPHWGPYLAAPGVLRAMGERLAVPIDAALVPLWEKLGAQLGDDQSRTRYVGIPGPPATARIAARLAEGYSAFVTPDFNLGRAGGLSVPFMGRELPATTGPARLAIEGGVPVVPLLLSSDTPLTYRLAMAEPLYVPGEPADVLALTRRIYAWMDAVVRQDPALWWGWAAYDPRFRGAGERPEPRM